MKLISQLQDKESIVGDWNANRVFHVLLERNTPAILEGLSKLTQEPDSALPILVNIYLDLKNQGKILGSHNEFSLATRKFCNTWELLSAEQEKNKISSLMEEYLESVFDVYIRLSELIIDNCYDGERLDLAQLVVESYDVIEDLVSVAGELPSTLSSSISWGWRGASSGELARAHVFSEIFNYLDKIPRFVSPVILIDEADLYLHPEWQRLFLDDLLKLFSHFEQTRCIRKPQLILCTHSPIIISDFLAEDIFSIRRDDYGNFETFNSIGFGSSITEIYMKDMHLQSTFGEHARRKITHLLRMADRKKLSPADYLLIEKISNRSLRNLLTHKGFNGDPSAAQTVEM